MSSSTSHADEYPNATQPIPPARALSLSLGLDENMSPMHDQYEQHAVNPSKYTAISIPTSPTDDKDSPEGDEEDPEYSSPFPSREGPPVIKCVNVHKTYLLGTDGVPALRGVNINIYKGEFIIILGKSGGGKTSLLNILGTIDKPSKGELYLAGNRITSATTDREFARLRLHQIGFIFQQFNLVSTMTALENVELPMILAGTLNRTQIRTRAKLLLEMVGLGHREDHLPSNMSGGEQQRVTIVRAIANNPSILLCDEPTGDLDTHSTHIIMSMLLRLNRQEGLTVVMVTHDNDLVDYAHRVIHVLDGKVVRFEEVSPQSRLAKEKLLEEQLITDQSEKLQLIEQDKGITEVRDIRFYSELEPVLPPPITARDDNDDDDDDNDIRY